MFKIVAENFVNNWYLFLICAVISYLIGSINPAVIVTKIATKGKADIRDMGSGNAGFTNVLRSVGKGPAIITIVCDALKCIAAVFIAYFIFVWFAGITGGDEWFKSCFLKCVKYFAGVFCILGHCFPLYFHFKGGKGIVTAAALMLASDWRVFLLILATFLIVFIISKIISLGSITGALMYAPYTFAVTFIFDHLLTQSCLWYVLVSTFCALVVGIFATVMHKENINKSVL